MSSVWIAVASGADADVLREELEDFGMQPRVIEGCDPTLDAVRKSGRNDRRTLVIDSKLIAAVARSHRNLVDEIADAADPGLRILVMMTKAGGIKDETVKAAMARSHSVVHAPASPADVRLRIRSLTRA